MRELIVHNPKVVFVLLNLVLDLVFLIIVAAVLRVLVANVNSALAFIHWE